MAKWLWFSLILVACAGRASPNAGSAGVDPCFAPLDETIECDARAFVWAYDPKKNECFEYVYGGCPSEQVRNRFPSQATCAQECVKPRK